MKNASKKQRRQRIGHHASKICHRSIMHDRLEAETKRATFDRLDRNVRCGMLWFLLLARFCRAVSLDNCTFREAEQGGWCGRVENLSTLESWSQEGSGSITKSRERS